MHILFANQLFRLYYIVRSHKLSISTVLGFGKPRLGTVLNGHISTEGAL